MISFAHDEVARAKVLIDLGRIEAAQAKLGAVLAGEPDNADALMLMGYAWFRVGEYEKSIGYSAAALAAFPDYQSALRVLALAEQELAHLAEHDPAEQQRHYDRALAAATRSAELDPEYVENLRLLAGVQSVTDPVAALATIDRAIEIDPAHADLHRVRGSILRRGGFPAADAEAALREALRLQPEHVDATQELALLDLDRGDREAGERGLRLVAQWDPSRADFVRATLAAVDAEARREPEPLSTPMPPPPEVRYLPETPRSNWRIWVSLIFGGFLVLRLIFAAADSNPETEPSRRSPTHQVPTYRVPGHIPTPSFPPAPQPWPPYFPPTAYPWPSNFPRPGLTPPRPPYRTPPVTIPPRVP
ncbi:tetratricopeptide repeat protein [Nocardia bhagyanarayanae]|uniref:Tetratricopeptide repeat protein n=1 Tax=Nocardia bhagyanarayanae TaxID=1215925 RepID=A0A543F619_9NOCA|nr:tetratricopeptide repeat protein [Nocardia bhagyanarayanae]TQM29278.1 tetratricopeptide repeat protein [Nocardia bhagyanarayanae]